jgi:hypothetical protein
MTNQRIEPWTEDEDSAHPSPEGLTRFILERHYHLLQRDDTDEIGLVNVTAIYRDCFGPSIELGPFSMSPGDARALALSLSVLASVCDDEMRAGEVL